MMGPNGYLTPPGAFTPFHKDGGGTVDAGHLCLTGYNEVVILRQLPEIHEEQAMSWLELNGEESKHGAQSNNVVCMLMGNKNAFYFNVLTYFSWCYSQYKQDWPTKDWVDKCRRMK